jgi:hypothetical protein
MNCHATAAHCHDPRAVLVRSRIADLEREAAMDHRARLARRPRTPAQPHLLTRFPSMAKRLRTLVRGWATGAPHPQSAPCPVAPAEC